jgi:hypothetical protein
MKNRSLIVFAVILLVVAAVWFSSQQFAFRASSPSQSAGITGKSLSQFQEIIKNYDASTDASTSTVSLDRKIISTASIQLEVKNVQIIFNEITNITVAQGGFISSSSVYDAGGRNNGQVTVRVPQTNFYQTVEQIETLGMTKSKHISGQDVTEEFIDTGARLDNLKKQEARLQEILKMANTVKDVLEVEHELERVRGEIERLTGRLNYLNRSVEMSTITVNAAEPAPFTIDEGLGITDAVKQSVRGFIESIKGIIIFTGIILPILVYIALIILIALGIKRNILPRFRE